MKNYRVQHGEKVRLEKLDPGDSGGLDRASAEAELKALQVRMEALQERLYASATHALLIVLQAPDAGGKDGTIKHVFDGINPQGCVVTSFKVPTPLEQKHDFLWRVHAAVPPRGMIGIFNRSHYEDILVPSVHGGVEDRALERRYQAIEDFERHLSENGVTILKFFLHISKEEQLERLNARKEDPEKRWKLSPFDFEERKLWDKYMETYQHIFERTSTDFAPWHIVPANRKWYRNLVIARAIVQALEGMKLEFPQPTV